MDTATTAQTERRPARYRRPHWSYSQLSQYMRCPLQYYFERIARLSRPFTPSSLAFGAAIHEGLATYHRQLQHRGVVDAQAVQESFFHSWMEQEQQHPIQFRDKETRDATLEKGVGLLQTYLAEPPPQEIVAVEQSLIVPIITSQGEILDKPLVAVVDLLHREQGTLTVNEFKTSGRRYGEFEADTTLQATCYAHAVNERYDEVPDIQYTVLVKTKQPAVQRLTTNRTEFDCGRLGDIVQQIDQAIEARVFYPVESPMNCSGCAYRLPCRAWQGSPRGAVTLRSGH